MARFFRRGTTKIYFDDTIADINAPTAAELADATELSCEMAEIAGFSFSNSPIDVPDMCDVFVKKIPGEDTAEDSSMTFYEDDGGFASNTIQSTLAKGTEGYVIIFPFGIAGASPAAADEAEVWPVSVASMTREYTAGNDPARYMAEFTVTDVPDQSATVA